MIGIQEQQKQNNILNRSQRRTPLNVVVEKIGSARAVVHGDLSKETLKELLMSELSLISKVQSAETKDAMTLSERKSLIHGISEINTNGDKENISKKSKSQEKGRELKKIVKDSKLMETDKQELKSEDYTNTDIKLQEQDKDVSNEFQKGGKDVFENEAIKTTEGAKTTKIEKKDGKKYKEVGMGEKQNDKQELKSEDYTNTDIILQEQDKDVSNEFKKGRKDVFENEVTKTTEGAKTTEIENKVGKKYKEVGMGEKQNEDKEKERQGKIREDKDIAKKSDTNYQNEETENFKKDSKGKGTKTETTKIDFDRKGKNEYEDQEKSIERDQIITSQQTKDILQEKEKMKITDRTIKYLYRKKNLKTAEKKIISRKENREIGRFTMKEKSLKKNGHFDITKQIEEILDDEDFTEDYEKEDRESCFSKISSDTDILTLSYDGKWLKQYLKKPLILAMNEIVEKKPKDPVNYLGFWLLNYRSSQENLQRKKALEAELLAKRNEWNMLHTEAKKIPELIAEEETSKHSEEEENIVDWNFSSYGFR